MTIEQLKQEIRFNEVTLRNLEGQLSNIPQKEPKRYALFKKVEELRKSLEKKRYELYHRIVKTPVL